MSTRAHWNHIYATKAPDQVSWFRPHLETSLALIDRTARDRSARIIDVGSGESTLIDDLIRGGYKRLTVLDISRTALDFTKARLGSLAAGVEWIVADVTQADFPRHAYDVWHDRAVFHFLTSATQRTAYVERVARAVRPGGHVIIGAFGPEGPSKCSGLDVRRYDAASLHGEFGRRFRLVDSVEELHQTPFGSAQQFLYFVLRRRVTRSQHARRPESPDPGSSDR